MNFLFAVIYMSFGDCLSYGALTDTLAFALAFVFAFALAAVLAFGSLDESTFAARADADSKR